MLGLRFFGRRHDHNDELLNFRMYVRMFEPTSRSSGGSTCRDRATGLPTREASSQLDEQANLSGRYYSYFFQEWMTLFAVEHHFREAAQVPGVFSRVTSRMPDPVLVSDRPNRCYGKMLVFDSHLA